MSIDEAKAAKAALCEQLKQIVCAFAKDTGLTVERVNLDQHISMRGVYGYSVDVEVRL